MWITLSILLAGVCVGLHFFWRDRAEKLASEISRLQGELEQAREDLDHAYFQMRSHQQGVFNSMVEGLLLLDTQARVHTTNKTLERLFSINRDIRGLTLMEAFRNHDLLEVVERVQREGQVRGFELTLPGIQQTRYLEVNASAIRDPENERDEIIIVFHDFTRIKELESLRRDFVANVSHELRTPLTLIKGFVETLIDGAKDDPNVAGKFLQTIHKHTNRLAFLIEDLLTISHLESGRLVMQRQELRLHSLVERVLDELQSPAGQRKVTLENLVPEELEITADADRMQQVLYNLVDNAIKYGREGGLVQVGAGIEEQTTEVFVRDNGAGIPREAQDRVFERFFRVDRARSRDQGGTGLGLSIVKHIVQAHGGEVWVKSETGSGSTFFFTLPDPAS